jgi:hypothetical protein
LTVLDFDRHGHLKVCLADSHFALPLTGCVAQLLSRRKISARFAEVSCLSAGQIWSSVTSRRIHS